MVKILIAGDYSPRNRVSKLINEANYMALFNDVRDINNGMDYSIVNFETTIPLKNSLPIKKTGPNLKTTIKAIDALVYAGFDCLTLANNHFYDYGEDGVNETLKICKEKKIEFMGGGRNLSEARKILYKDIKGVKFAFVNFCENEWSIATDNRGGSAPLDIINNFYDIKEAKLQSDYVIVITHGGSQLYQLPTFQMKKNFHFFIDIGADIVINHHQHCFSGYEEYNGKYIFYGLGNFCFDSEEINDKKWNEGYMLSLKICNGISFEIIPYNQCRDKAGVFLMKKDEEIEFYKKIEYLNTIILDDKKLKKCHNEQLKEENLLMFLEPYANRYLHFLRKRKILPSFLSDKRKRLLLNLIRCETHRDNLIELLSKED